LERLISTVAAGLGEEEAGVPPEHDTAKSPQRARSRSARRISFRE
jgi:hypothetical protein